MEYVRLNEIRDELRKSFKKRNILPILGAGFSMGSNARNGITPSGNQCKSDMINFILKYDSRLNLKIVEKWGFSRVASVFFDKVPKEQIRTYFSDKFTKVRLPERQRNFLNIDWWYIYTINVDDAIEKNSDYSNVIDINKEFYEDILDANKCVLKLHGNVHEYVQYKNSNLIFSIKEYIKSINNNKFLLNKLANDYFSNNLIYIGCSLADEFDILSVIDNANSDYESTERYLVSQNKFNIDDEYKLDEYCISKIILVDDYDIFYDEMYSIWQESNQISSDEIELFKGNKSVCGGEQSLNQEYLFYGKDIIVHNEAKLPYYFIERSKLKEFGDIIDRNAITLLRGNICSGRTYLMASLAIRLPNKDVYIFQSFEKLSKKAFESVINKKNAYIFFDSKCLNYEQIEEVFEKSFIVKGNNSHIIIVCDKYERDIDDSILFMKNCGKDVWLSTIQLDNRFDAMEIESISKKLTVCGIPTFSINKSIINNIFACSQKLEVENRFSRYEPITSDVKSVVSLILLMLNKKVFSKDVTFFDLFDAFEKQYKAVNPLIERRDTQTFEISGKDTSGFKYILNTDVWLRSHMQKIAKKDQFSLICDSYKYIIYKLIAAYGKPDLNYNSPANTRRHGIFKHYIMFDNINRIFFGEEKKKPDLILEIYKCINEYLSNDANYMHQFAKCYLKDASFYNNDIDKKCAIKEAYNKIQVAIDLFEKRYEISKNDRVLISLDHTKYTRAIIKCFQAKIEEFLVGSTNETAIKFLYEAFRSTNNSYQYALKDKHFDVKKMFEELLNKVILSDNEKSHLSEEVNFLWQMIRTEE